MKLIQTNEDEYRAQKGKLTADVFFMGDGSAEVKIWEEGPELIKSEKARNGKINAFAAALSKKIRKKDIRKVLITAEQGSMADKALADGKCASYDYSEYILKKAPGVGAAIKEESTCIILDTKSAEDTDFEQKNAIIVRSREEGVFTAKIMPYMDGMYVYEVEVKEELRRKGYGTKHMEALLQAFSDAPIYLQVSSRNEAAVGLYKKLGFETETGINYYIL